jgi:hypothetical protein
VVESDMEALMKEEIPVVVSDSNILPLMADYITSI